MSTVDDRSSCSPVCVPWQQLLTPLSLSNVLCAGRCRQPYLAPRSAITTHEERKRPLQCNFKRNSGVKQTVRINV